MHSAASIAGLVGTLFASAVSLPAAPPLAGVDRDRVVFVEEESTIACGCFSLLSQRPQSVSDADNRRCLTCITHRRARRKPAVVSCLHRRDQHAASMGVRRPLPIASAVVELRERLTLLCVWVV
jgi:hypothetical protein